MLEPKDKLDSLIGKAVTLTSKEPEPREPGGFETGRVIAINGTLKSYFGNELVVDVVSETVAGVGMKGLSGYKAGYTHSKFAGERPVNLAYFAISAG